MMHWRGAATGDRTGVGGMEAFGIIGMSLGTMGFIFALNAMNSVASLEKRLKEAGVLEPEEETD